MCVKIYQENNPAGSTAAPALSINPLFYNYSNRLGIDCRSRICGIQKMPKEAFAGDSKKSKDGKGGKRQDGFAKEPQQLKIAIIVLGAFILNTIY